MSSRYSQKIRNIAKEKSYGMVKISIDGRFMPLDEDKVGVDIEGPMSKYKFDLVREFLWKITEMPNEPAAPVAQKEQE